MSFYDVLRAALERQLVKIKFFTRPNSSSGGNFQAIVEPEGIEIVADIEFAVTRSKAKGIEPFLHGVFANTPCYFPEVWNGGDFESLFHGKVFVPCFSGVAVWKSTHYAIPGNQRFLVLNTTGLNANQSIDNLKRWMQAKR